jgi:hypothetical protein
MAYTDATMAYIVARMADGMTLPDWLDTWMAGPSQPLPIAYGRR